MTGRGVVAFPGAGSFGGQFQPLLRALGRSAWLARYPGRFGPDLGTPAASFDAVARACVDQVNRRKPVRPVFVGHSYGAYVAYASAAKLAGQGVDVSALVVVGATPPEHLALAGSVVRARSDTAAYLEAVEPGLLSGEATREWRDLVVDTARQDLVLLRGLRAADYGPVSCPVFAVRGEADPLTSDDRAVDWAGTTEGPFSTRVFAGGHSDLLESSEFAAWLREAVIAST